MKINNYDGAFNFEDALFVSFLNKELKQNKKALKKYKSESWCDNQIYRNNINACEQLLYFYLN